jgi:uncharacterized DUF497 family protein
MQIEWDPEKADSNLEKHGVSFEEAVTALLDPLALAIEDTRSQDEARWVLIGMSTQVRLIVVVYTLRHDDLDDDSETIRIISARPAMKSEASTYAKNL